MTEKHADAATSLDPVDWNAFRRQGHQMLDDMCDFLAAQAQGDGPVWQPAPASARERFSEPLPLQGGALEDIHAIFKQDILPYAVGNTHPGFMGWAHGAGTPVGMLAEMLVAGLNANVGGRNQIPVAVEGQIVAWMRDLFGFPGTASGLFVTGSSMANMIAVLVARRRSLGDDVRRSGVSQTRDRLVAYTSAAAHGCISQAMDLAGLGTTQLRKIATAKDGAMNLAVLEASIAADKAAGMRPFLIVGTAGTVDTGAFDDLAAVGAIARREQVHFHVDGAFGALAILAPALQAKLQGVEHADSIAMDFHKWLHVPYDAGFVLVRDGDLHLRTFSEPEKTYLARFERGIAAGSPWPCDIGPDLSRGFRALKTWFTFQVYGANRLGQAIAHNCELAAYMARRIAALPQLELMAPVALNIVCFRFRFPDNVVEELNRTLLIEIQESGVAAPSSTTLDGQFSLRAAFFNHRSTAREVDKLLDFVLARGQQLSS